MYILHHPTCVSKLVNSGIHSAEQPWRKMDSKGTAQVVAKQNIKLRCLGHGCSGHVIKISVEKEKGTKDKLEVGVNDNDSEHDSEQHFQIEKSLLQWFCFQNITKYSWDTYTQNKSFLFMKAFYFWGGVTDNLANTGIVQKGFLFGQAKHSSVFFKFRFVCFLDTLIL